jgi:hypothetical protein
VEDVSHESPRVSRVDDFFTVPTLTARVRVHIFMRLIFGRLLTSPQLLRDDVSAASA